MATDEYGVDDGWWSADGHWHDADPDTLRLLRDRFEESAARPAAPLWCVRTGEAAGLRSRCALRLDDGTDLGELDRLPPDLTPGVHRLTPLDGGPTTTLVVAPDRLDTWPRQPRWGVAVQAYAALTDRSWWIGDLRDLGELGRWIGGHGGSVLGLSPLCEPLPTTPRQPSPYSPSSRSHLDPLIVAFGDDERPAPRPAGAERVIDRDAAWEAKLAAFRSRWDGLAEAERDRRAEHVRRAAAAPERDRAVWHAVFDHLALHHGTGWTQWPEAHRRPDSTEVSRRAAENAIEVAFLGWVHEQAEDALARTREDLARAGVSLMGDLPVGVSPDGFEAWFDQDLVAHGWRVGAPPDPLGPRGQDWGLPPLDPHLLRAAAYAPWLETLRSNLGRYDGLRIDHVMGLFRLFWIPPGGDPSHGTYVRTRPGELLDLLVAVAARSGAFVVGEDLGTVEAGARETLRDRGIAGTKVAWFEDEPPERWPAQSLGTLTTHDLPTTTGALSGADPASDEGMARRMVEFAGGGPDVEPGDAPADAPADVLVRAHERLAAAGSAVVLAALEDVVGSPDRVNMPGTVDEYPNWRVPLPEPVDRLARVPLAEDIARALDRSARPSVHGDPAG